MNIKPLFDRVVILPDTHDNMTNSGIILPETSQGRPQTGQVVAVGDGTDFDGNQINMKVGVGDKVVYNKYSGAEFKIDDKIYVIIRQIDVIGVIE